MAQVLVVITNLQQSFLSLVRLGIGLPVSNITIDTNWNGMEALARQQGLLPIIVDGIGKLPDAERPPKELLLQWIGEVLQGEATYAAQKEAAAKLAELFHNNAIRTYVLKGMVVAECYPNPVHRVSADLDCYLKPIQGDFDAWELGNGIVESQGYEVDCGFYKNSTFILPGLTVENHKFLSPFRGNSKLERLERVFQSMLLDDEEDNRFDNVWLYRPPIMVSALFLIEHAYSHFLHEGLTWRMVLDWMLFCRKHKEDLYWNDLDNFIEEFGFKRFYESFVKIGLFLLGEITEDKLSKENLVMLSDIWAPLDWSETSHGIKGKLDMVGATLRARWKYRYFGDISMLHALWIQVYGYLFIKNPKLEYK